MKQLILFFLIFLMSPTYSQIVTEKYADGQIKSEFLNGNLEKGEWVSYYENGQIKEKGTYLNGIEEGEWIYYNKRGRIGTKICYINGYEEEIEYYYYKHGKLYEIATQYPEEEGYDFNEITLFYKNGKISSRGCIRDSTKRGWNSIGEWAYYNKNGHIDYIINYKDGKANWEVQEFYINGITYWMSGDPNGGIVTYYKNGQIKEKGDVSAKLQTVLWFFSFYKMQKEGEWTYFDKNGKPKRSKTYFHGKRIK